MKKLFLRMYFFILTLGLFSVFNIALANEPVSMLSSVANQMIADLKSHKATLKSNPSLVYSFTNRIVVPHANLDAMSLKVLPPKTWKNATPAQRSEFKKEFTRVLERTYASALANYTDETVRFYPIRGNYQNKSTLMVDSQILRSDGPSIRVSYRLVNSNSEWKLYDMSVEGISMLESFRSQFADKLSRGNMAELIASLKQHNRRM